MLFSLDVYIGEQLLNFSTTTVCHHIHIVLQPCRRVPGPDYLANRAGKKLRVRLREKLHGNRETVGHVNGGGVGARVS